MAKCILAIDDNEDILDCLDMILNMEGYSVHTRLSPENIGNDIVDLKPDLILLDIQMGACDGLEVCKKLKTNPYTASIPILMISSDDRIFRAVHEFGADGIIPKPFHMDSLLNKVSGFLLAKVIPITRASA